MKILSSSGLDPTSELNAIAKGLKNKDEIKCWTRQRSAAPAAGFQNLSFGEKVSNLIGINKKITKDVREEAFDAISSIINGTKIDNSEQLLLNIRFRMESTGKLRGKDVAGEIQRHLQVNKDNVLRGAFVPAPKNASINLMHVSPLRVVAQHAILRSTTLAQVVLNNKDLADVAVEINQQTNKIRIDRNDGLFDVDFKETFEFNNQTLATPKTCVIVDLHPNEISCSKKFIDENQLKKLYESVLKDLAGTIVLEPFPDEANRSGAGNPIQFIYTDENLKIMLLAVREAVKNTNTQSKKLQVTIATDDPELAKRIKDLDESLKLKSATASISSIDNDYDNTYSV